MSLEKPMGVSIIVCDRVITEAGTMNKTLVSTFNTIYSKAFPCAHPGLSVFVALTNASGDKDVKLKFMKEGRIFAEMGGRVKFEGPNSVVELIFNLRNLTFTEPGVYSFEVTADDDYIFETRFSVVQVT